jgi:hypothetical protein
MSEHTPGRASLSPVAASGEFQRNPETTEQAFGLHNEMVTLSANEPLRGLAEARERHVNGAILAEMALPSPIGKGSGELKNVGVVDYGEDWEGKPLFDFKDVAPGLPAGRAESRYYLVGTNYSLRESPYPPHFPIRGAPVVIGRDPGERAGAYYDAQDVRLGLAQSSDPNNKYISGAHLTVGVSDGQLRIRDHSRHGTGLVVSPQQRPEITR